MALNDKVEQNKSMQELLKETKKLNELMMSYIRVQMNEETSKNLTIESQLEQIREKSHQVMANMEKTLSKQEQMLSESEKTLRGVLTDGQQTISNNNARTIEKLEELDQNNQKRLQALDQEISSSTAKMQRELKDLVQNAQKDSRDLVAKAKKGAMASYWGDAFKYGLATSAITVPLLLIGQWLFF